MKSLILSVTGVIVFQLSFGQNWEWVRTGEGIDCNFGESITTDNSGNIYTIGNYDKNITFYGPSGNASLPNYGFMSDIFLVKHDSAGNLIWAKKAGGPQDDYGSAIQFQNGFLHIAGVFGESGTFDTITLSPAEGNMFIAKYTTDGDVVWAKQYGGDSCAAFATSIFVNHSGEIALSGFFSGKFTTMSDSFTSVGEEDLLTMKLDSAGNILWIDHAGSSGRDYAYDVCMDADDNVYTTGYHYSTVAFDSISVTAIKRAIFIVKYDPFGNAQWVKTIDGGWDNSGNAIGIRGSKIFVAGDFQYTAQFDSISLVSSGYTNLFLAALNLDGTTAWATKLGSTSIARAMDLVISKDGALILTGLFGGTLFSQNDTLISLGNEDVFLGKFDSAGNNIWIMRGGGPGSDYGFGVHGDKEENIYLTGEFFFTALFGSVEISYTFECNDVFIAKVSDPSVGIKELDESPSVLVYPNPSMGSVIIKCDASYSVSVFNSIGVQMFDPVYLNTGKSSLDLSELPTGFYYLSFTNKESSFSRKIILF